MFDKSANKQLAKGLKEKKRRPSWLARYNRKRLIEKLRRELEKNKVLHAWAHQDFLSAVEKKPSTIIIYAEFPKESEEGIAHRVDGEMDKQFSKFKANIIDVNSLLPTIKESIFKELAQIF